MNKQFKPFWLSGNTCREGVVSDEHGFEYLLIQIKEGTSHDYNWAREVIGRALRYKKFEIKVEYPYFSLYDEYEVGPDTQTLKQYCEENGMGYLFENKEA